MKTQRFFLTVLLIVLPIIKQQAQEKPEDKTSPDTRYNVNREYDENGNLIGYDSSSVTTWGYSGSDSLADIWSYTPGVDDTVSIDHPRPYSYNFKLPGDEFLHIPQFGFDIDFPDIDSILKGFEFNFSMAPPDSSMTPCYPYFDFHGSIPPMDFDIESYFYEMQRMMDDMLDRHQEFYRDFSDPDLQPSESDSITSPPVPEPMPAPQKYSEPELDI
jgi:hypothetical protein